MQHTNEQVHVIFDWAGNLMFNGKQFPTFEDADEFLSDFFDKTGKDYDEWRGEYYIESLE